MTETPHELPEHLRTLAPSPFPGDDGAADPAVRSALALGAADGAATTAGDPSAYLRAVAALCTARLLVPVVATRIGEATVAAQDGLVSDKEAEMAVVLLENADGQRAMLAFTGTDALTAWDPSGRPVPVTLDLAARSALSDGAVALVVDIAGPHPLALETALLEQLAAGHRLVELDDGGFGWAVPADPASGTDARRTE
ncbi:hypothetical protein FHX74_002929 [Friedmanniella endophytica]|uniref:SseB protein N-terminal domain-containing protein n=1 Tax=Microlunatus kandeliicorticis TaxID=1759536 RepID=A0A7W3P6Q7_9ACTN|nr:SseB family protein [Microlunatus kandeliicorticis]MBA8795301.1 hypothetical protein [Microlunatus kandeliicorticis]